jgi:hypothetical protein
VPHRPAAVRPHPVEVEVGAAGADQQALCRPPGLRSNRRRPVCARSPHSPVLSSSTRHDPAVGRTGRATLVHPIPPTGRSRYTWTTLLLAYPAGSTPLVPPRRRPSGRRGQGLRQQSLTGVVER